MSTQDAAYLLSAVLTLLALFLGASTQAWWSFRKDARWIKAEREKWQNTPEVLAEQVLKQVLQSTGITVELLERVQCDLVFLHDAMYLANAHPRDCPVCASTLPHVEAAIHRLKNAKGTVRIEGL